MKDLYKKLKMLTGYNYADVAEEFEISRQRISQYTKNSSMAYVNANKYMIIRLVNKKIRELEKRIDNLRKFIAEVDCYGVKK